MLNCKVLAKTVGFQTSYYLLFRVLSQTLPFMENFNRFKSNFFFREPLCMSFNPRQNQTNKLIYLIPFLTTTNEGVTLHLKHKNRNR